MHVVGRPRVVPVVADRLERVSTCPLDRLVAIGAQRVDWVYPDGADFVVLSDTEGNLFCVIK